MSVKLEHENREEEITRDDDQLDLSKINQGMRRGWIQIERTMTFEFLRNGSKMFAMLLTAAGIFTLFLVIQVISENKGATPPEDSGSYFQNYLGMIDFLILIIATTFFGSIIAEDFEKETGNLLFPKIPKERLLLGRVIARYIYAFFVVAFYYLLVAVTTFIKYEGVPKIVWESMLWAELYLFGVIAFFTLASSLFKRSATAMITGLLAMLILFNLLSMIFMFTGITAEPFYFLTYYANIITACFNMPETRYGEFGFGGPGGAGGPATDATYYQWITPSPIGAILGILIYSIVCFGLAYLIYRRKQN